VASTLFAALPVVIRVMAAVVVAVVMRVIAVVVHVVAVVLLLTVTMLALCFAEEASGWCMPHRFVAVMRATVVSLSIVEEVMLWLLGRWVELPIVSRL